MDDRFIQCILVDKKIEDIDCIENREIVDGNLSEESLPEEYKTKVDWKNICKNCKWHKY